MSKRFLPTATIETLQLRAKLIASLREFFSAHGYWECETPILSRDVIVDANLDPFVTNDISGPPLYLQTSPEAGMKRLLAAGATAIVQITRVMRRGEIGRLHNPEFSMVEWYRVGDDHHDQMSFVEKLVRSFFAESRQLLQHPWKPLNNLELPTQCFERLTYDEAFERFAGSRVLHLSSAEICQLAKENNVEVPAGLALEDRDGWLNLLLAEVVEPQLGRLSPQFVYDYPASQAALARVRRDDFSLSNAEATADSRAVAERFELYIQGIELCNGYHELTDVDEFVERSKSENQQNDSSFPQQLPQVTFLEQAMREGMPDCSGVALGLDRLVMLALGHHTVSDVIAFPGERA
ncbi:MAG: EF-P lysine aminoacylase EpmA [Planctomycetota bacterium]|nr:EF-P lysine aminoacylase EpmA [Planctomycetota bacterium]